MTHISLVLLFLVTLNQSAFAQVVYLKVFAANASSIDVEVDLCQGQKLSTPCKTIFTRADKLQTKAIAKEIDLHGLKPQDLSLEILTFKDEESTRGKVALLPQRISDAILSFLVVDPSKTYKEFNCRSFAHWVNQLDFKHGEYRPSNWNFGKPVDTEDHKEILSLEKSLTPGETILLESTALVTTTSLPYWAIYLGEGLYITKFGFADELGVATLKELARLYGSSQVRAVRKSGEELFLPCTIL